MSTNAPARPNIVLMIADDQRHSAMGCCDDPCADPVRTPHLDRLAAEGAHLTHAFHRGSLIGAVCAPSRAMLHTGLAPKDLPARFFYDRNIPGYIEGDAPLLGELLREAGYHTHHIGKWHNGEEALRRSFKTGSGVYMHGMGDHFNLPYIELDDEISDEGSYSKGVAPGGYIKGAHSTDLFQRRAEEFLDGVDSEKPFLLSVAFTAPHDPRATHRCWHDRYPANDMPVPPNFRERYEPDGPELGIRDELLAPTPRQRDQVQRDMSDYFAMVEHMDHAIGQIAAKLDALGLADNTIIIHTADHGLAVGQHGLMGKQNMHDHSVRVPLVMRGPGITPGSKLDGLCYQHDLFPTLLEAAGVNPPNNCAFRSLWPMLRGEQRDTHDQIESFYADLSTMVRTRDEKEITFHRDGSSFTYRYNLADDPWEMNPQKE